MVSIRQLRALARWLPIAVLAQGLAAQSGNVLTRVSASAKDAIFLVDGRAFTGSAAFTWPAGSKHELAIQAWQFSSGLKARYTFQQWSTPAGPLPSHSNYVTITADAGVSSYSADLTTEYALTLVFFQCAQARCLSPGIISVNEVAYQHDADVWLPAGSAVSLLATPNPGFVFNGWAQGPSAPLYSLTLNQPMTLYPSFSAARTIQLLTSPDGLELLADRAPVSSPATLEWGMNTAHTLGVVSPQWDLQGKLWVFRSWSDGGAQTHPYVMPPGASAATVIAQFARGVPVAVATDPEGLNVTVDGAALTAPQSIAWAPGESHQISAPARQNDSAGGPWVFRSWSNGAANPQTIIAGDAQVATGIRLTAVYDPMSRIRVESAPAGLTLSVDGADCRTPCEVERAVGATVRLGAPASIPSGDGARLEFAGWDGAAGGSLTAAAGYHKVTARFNTSYRLQLSVDPAGAGSCRATPGRDSGYYPAGSTVSLTPEPAEGMRFRGWGADLIGHDNPAAIVMNAPHAVSALFERAPDTPAPPRVANAAGDTPTDAVAPGSIASVFGDDLADAEAQGTTDPLPQSLSGVTLRVEGRLAPLLYASPKQVNFQVPSDLAPGAHRLEILRGGAPSAEAAFTVSPNAPGLLLAAHEDGSRITADSPAAAGERILLYGTGLGVFSPPPLDGFRVPAGAVCAATDPVEVIIEGRTVQADSAVALTGAVGVAVVRARVPDDVDSALRIRIRVAGAESNTW